MQVSCWGPLFSEPSPEGAEPLHKAVGALVLRLASQQRRRAKLVENEASDNAFDLLQVTRPDRKLSCGDSACGPENPCTCKCLPMQQGPVAA